MPIINKSVRPGVKKFLPNNLGCNGFSFSELDCHTLETKQLWEQMSK